VNEPGPCAKQHLAEVSKHGSTPLAEVWSYGADEFHLLEAPRRGTPAEEERTLAAGIGLGGERHASGKGNEAWFSTAALTRLEEGRFGMCRAHGSAAHACEDGIDGGVL
jgi:hypothetical protein